MNKILNLIDRTKKIRNFDVKLDWKLHASELI